MAKPSRASRRATARPMPPEAPVMIAVLVGVVVIEDFLLSFVWFDAVIGDVVVERPSVSPYSPRVASRWWLNWKRVHRCFELHGAYFSNACARLCQTRSMLLAFKNERIR